MSDLNRREMVQLLSAVAWTSVFRLTPAEASTIKVYGTEFYSQAARLLMEVHELEITIAPDGELKVEVKGAKGAACMEYAKRIESIFSEAHTVEHTSEYYEPATGVEIHLEDKGS